MHDLPAEIRFASSGETPADVQRELAQVQQEFQREDASLRAKLRMRLASKAQRAVNRNLRRLSIGLTLWRYNKRLERRDLVQNLLEAGRSIVEVGLALISRLRDEDKDPAQQDRIRQFRADREAYREFLSSREARASAA